MFWKIYGRRDRKTDINYLSIFVYLDLPIFFYIYVYIDKEGKKKREGEKREEKRSDRATAHSAMSDLRILTWDSV